MANPGWPDRHLIPRTKSAKESILRSTMRLETFACLFFAAPLALGTVFLNEIRIDQPGSDNDEYFELFSDAPESDDLSPLSLIVIGDGSGGSGVIENVTSFSGITSPFATGSYFLVAEASFSVGVADFTTELTFENSDNVTFLLVDGFTGMGGDDLDSDDDGVLDAMPWSRVLDAIGLLENIGGIPVDANQEYGYGDAFGASVGPDGNFVPGHVFRQSDAPGAWAIGDFGLGGDAALDTPGAANAIPEPSVASLYLLGLACLMSRRRQLGQRR